MKVVVVTIVNADGENECGSAYVEDNDIKSATDEAMQIAEERFSSDQGYDGLKSRTIVQVIELPEPKVKATQVEFTLPEETDKASNVNVSIVD
jgi:hypothetical protein